MDPFLGEIRLFAINFAPKGWLPCEGQILQINQNQALYSLLGAVYGGDGRTTFALPDLRGRVPIHFSLTKPLGTYKGEEEHTLTIPEIPMHTHTAYASSTTADQKYPLNNVWANANNLYHSPTALVQMNPSALSNAGGGQAHNNMQPFTVLNFHIATSGIFPSRN
ncbi:MAG TPA: phage tail protein [Bacillus bacterium]|nr:phage tail protein [Bacillus sp. (in: firmicutes)]